MDRRSFIETLGAVGGALATGACSRPASGAAPVASADRTDRLQRIGLQLYTIRQAMADDFDGSLARVAGIGYREVEFAGHYGRTPQQVRAVLDRTGLRAPSGHIPLDQLTEGWEGTLEGAQVIGHRYLVVAWLAPEDRTTERLKRIAELFNRAGESARRVGITFAYHNHDFEFVPVDGQLPYDVLLAATDPDTVKMEMDLFWIRKGGRDPLDYFARHPGRFPLVHVKDMDAADRMVDVGKGVIDWPRTFARREQAGIQHAFVEHDQPADPFDSIRSSYEYLQRLTFPGRAARG